MMKTRTLVLALVVALSGCVRYVEADLSDLRPDDRVRLQLEQEQLGRLLAFADPEDRSVSGRFVEASLDSISLVVQTPGSYTQVSVPRNSIIRSTRGVSDNKRNFIVSAAIVGGVAALAVAGFEGRGQNSVGDGTGTDESVVQRFGFRIPFSLRFGR